jgi:hypothetical protein
MQSNVRSGRDARHTLSMRLVATFAFVYACLSLSFLRPRMYSRSLRPLFFSCRWPSAPPPVNRPNQRAL